MQRLNYQKRHTSTELTVYEKKYKDSRIVKIYIYIYKIKERKKAFAYKALKEIYKWRYFKRKISSISLLGEIFVSNELRHGADMFYHILQS